MVLGRHVKPIEVLVLLEFLEDDLLLGELFLEVPELGPVFQAHVDDLGVVLHRDKPSQRTG